ncbi:MAG TPA: carbamoyl-phosphate synthase large subunit, partial [Actinomycetota bacterium]|nr:carbamoyl-phosphate synthase large subunit [Actinomycetota bacterium]
PRVSRSSALASKATGFPIAKIAALLAVGYRLDEITNDITGETPASFEPALDYVVVKVPRWAFEKFPDADPRLGTAMKSVGEVMAIGRTFREAWGKALRSLERPGAALGADDPGLVSDDNPLARLRTPTDDRMAHLELALRRGHTVEEVAEASGIDPWFVDQIAQAAEEVGHLVGGSLDDVAPERLRAAKRAGLSDQRIGVVLGAREREVRAARRAAGVQPVFKTVDTCAGEFRARTPYFYSTYEQVSEVTRADRPRVVILGAGPNRIGQGIEFDYACVHAAFALRRAGYETVMVNCNPETVSTDYDTSDRLYFEPVSAEDVLAVCEAEDPEGVIVQLGGQTPLHLAAELETEGFRILGTSPASIDLAEDRSRFAAMCRRLGVAQPPHGHAASAEEAVAVAATIGYPVVVRPSYVLGGRAMEIVYSDRELERYLARATEAGSDRPVLVDRFLEGAIEVDVDAVSDGREVFVGAVMEHIEEAGVHSGDSSCTIPPVTLSDQELDEVEGLTRVLAEALQVRGLLNVQFAVKDERVWVLEANPRASRTVPFVSKATGVPLAKVAARVLVGDRLADLRGEGVVPSVPGHDRHLRHVAVKAAVLPFGRFPGVDTVLGPEMRSTGEVMGIASGLGVALAKAQSGTGAALPEKGRLFVSVANRDKRAMVFPVKRLVDLGFEAVATRGTAALLARSGIEVSCVAKVSEGHPNAADLIAAGRVDLVINTPFGREPRSDGAAIRTAAAAASIPCVTTLQGVYAAVQGIEALQGSGEEPRSLQEYHRP